MHNRIVRKVATDGVVAPAGKRNDSGIVDLLKTQTHRAPPKRGPIIESKRFENLNNH